jgi:Pin2-interacting protein X1
MSMLAEPRRKNRMGPNPRGKFFSEDEDNRGRNMLQKMGWKNGDGLGVERQGITEPIKPKIQTDAKGNYLYCFIIKNL